MKKFLAVFLLVGISVLLFLFVKNKEKSLTSSKLPVTASFYPMYFFASYIGGDKVDVTDITPAGAEPHDYDPTPQDFVSMRNSKVLVLNGLVEPWENKIQENLKNTDMKIVIAGDGLGTIAGDPHVWLSPRLASIESQKITDAFVKADSVNANYYKQNEDNLLEKLNEIDRNFRDGFKDCDSKSFVTAHSAFNYLARDYGLTQIAIEGLSPDAEPSLSRLAQIADFAKKNGVKYIFFESLVSPKLSETIAGEIGAKTLVLDPIEGVTKENLAKGINYLTLMDANLQNLRVALNCK